MECPILLSVHPHVRSCGLHGCGGRLEGDAERRGRLPRRSLLTLSLSHVLQEEVNESFRWSSLCHLHLATPICSVCVETKNGGPRSYLFHFVLRLAVGEERVGRERRGPWEEGRKVIGQGLELQTNCFKAISSRRSSGRGPAKGLICCVLRFGLLSRLPKLTMAACLSRKTRAHLGRGEETPQTPAHRRTVGVRFLQSPRFNCFAFNRSS